MGLIFFLINFIGETGDKFFHWLDKRDCKKNGHFAWRTIERYSTKTVVKNYVAYGKKIVKVPPYQKTKVHGKFECGRCGALYVGFIVKDEPLHDTTHDTPA